MEHVPIAKPSREDRRAAGQHRLQAPRETEAELTARVSREVRRALRALAIAAVIGLGLEYVLR